MADQTAIQPTQEERDAAAADFLDCGKIGSEPYWEDTYVIGSQHWLILTDEEADARASDYIRESVWAFQPWFLVSYLPEGVTEEVIEALQPQCESANPAILSMIGDRFDEFVADSIQADGRGHFLNSWDGEEHEFEHGGREWFAYRS